ncbi:slit homolog 1 protein [Lingula anatina]|uniref:Slit homolog 1 protein n=1 Tax=Lingula anatina TaxID=7574 RepID=A0A1S3JRC1_LINAN|nr:slit homolog 1 protein [Lingula anatina]|eukprot:XP_013412887.1 slit homolog 1 protein [Lingula anatina]
MNLHHHIPAMAILLSLVSHVAADCPVRPPCTCDELGTNSDGTKSWSVNCVNKGLTMVPTFDTTKDSVEELLLGKNHISSISNDAFSTLKGLNFIDLSENNISYIGEKAFLGQKNSLEYLYLGKNVLTAIPVFAEDMSILRELVLSTNQMTTIPANAFHKTPALSKLYLNSNKISTIDGAAFDDIQNSLDLLNLQNNSLTSNVIQVLANLPKLRILYLAYNPLGNIPQAGFGQAFQSIQDLNLEFTQLSEFPVVLLSRFWKLRTLMLSGNQMASFDLPTVGNLTSTLQNLYLHNMGLTKIPKGIAQMKNLHRLELSRNSIATLDTCAFHNNTNLRTVSLSGNPLECTCNAAGLRFLQNILRKDFKGLDQPCPSESLKEYTVTTFPIDHCDTRDLCNSKLLSSTTSMPTQSPSASPVASGTATMSTVEVTTRLTPAMAVVTVMVVVSLR